VEPDFEISIELKELGQAKLHLRGESLYEFLEFVCLHPSMSASKDTRGRYYEYWIKRMGSAQ